MLWVFNDTAAALPTHECTHDLVAMQAMATPAAAALEWQDDTMTYAELLECAHKVAAWLRSNGVAPDCVVALQLHRSLEQIVGMLGTLLSASAYLPLEPKWPSDRLRFMMQDAESKQLVAADV